MQPTRVISFGCSFTWGDEIDGENQCVHSENSYAGLIAQHFSVPYLCLAIPGIGNDAIERMVTEYLMQDKQTGDIVVIGWSALTRREYIWRNSYRYLIANMKHNQMYQEFHDQIMSEAEWDLLDREYYQTVFRTQSILAYFGVTNIMVNCLVGPKNLNGLDISCMDFYSWVLKTEHPLGKGRHPLGEAHRAYSKLVLTALYEKYPLMTRSSNHQ